MYGICLDIRPTGGLTFRRMPSSIVHISTYPFVPPTTLSGWLRRLMMLKRGVYPETAVKKPNFYALPQQFQVLGAYPTDGLFHIHSTHRHGPMSQYNHVWFSKLRRTKPEKASQRNKHNLQLHTWEYLIVDRLRGYVLHPDPDALEQLRTVRNLGCKIGKEGFAYLESVSNVRKLEQANYEARPSTLVPATVLMGHPSQLFALYRYAYKSAEKPFDPSSDTPSAINGFAPFWAGQPEAAVKLNYWTDGEWNLPVAFGRELYA